MQLEQTLQMYEIRRDGVDRVISYDGLYELLSGNCGGGGGPGRTEIVYNIKKTNK